jgi:hypothetical protein
MYRVSKDGPVETIQSARIFQFKVFSRSGYSSTKYLASKDIPRRNIHLVEIFQYKIYSVSRDSPVPLPKVKPEKGVFVMLARAHEVPPFRPAVLHHGCPGHPVPRRKGKE